MNFLTTRDRQRKQVEQMDIEDGFSERVSALTVSEN